jgi:hypothetical protein
MAAFKYYLHDGYQGNERMDWIANQIPEVAALDTTALEELGQKVGRPFYEIELGCDLNLDTGKVTIVSVDGKPVTN